MSEELKPCPFCGGEAEIVDAEECGPQAYVVTCNGCMTSSRVIFALMDDVTFDLVSAWNTRADLCHALVAGAYEAAIRACINMGLLTDHPNDAGSTVLRALTPADAQAALDAAIRKAVNGKLDEVAAYCERHAMTVVTQPSKAEFCGSYVAVRTYGYGGGRHSGMAYAAAILEMKEPE